jgi:hypothetical protein
MKRGRIAGAFAAAIVVVGASGAEADVIFISETSSATADGSATAGGDAYAAGAAGQAKTDYNSQANNKTLSLNNGSGGTFSSGVGYSSGQFVGSGKSVSTETSAPVSSTSLDTKTQTHGDVTTITTTTTTTTRETTTHTTIETYESLNANATAFTDVASQFTSPTQATFTFNGFAASAYQGMAYTRILATPVTTTTVVKETTVTRITPQGTTTTEHTTTNSYVSRGPTSDTVSPGSDWLPTNYVNGYATAQASSDSTSDYTFEVLGQESLTLQYAGAPGDDGPFSFEIELMNDATNMLVGAASWFDMGSDGEATWSVISSGIYSLIITVGAEADGADGPWWDSRFAWSDSVFTMSMNSLGGMAANAAPELSTWAMMGIGFLGLGWIGFRRANPQEGRRLPVFVHQSDNAGRKKLL